MGFLDAFTGGSVTSAAKDAKALDASTGNFVDNAWLDALHGGQSELWNARNDTLDRIGSNVSTSQGILNRASDAARADLRGGYDTANGYLGQIQGLYEPYAANGRAATGMLADATGLNGSAGNNAATAAFRANPGYQWTVDQGTDAAARNASRLGIGASGNTLTALTTLGSHLADQEYGGWLDRLQGQAATGMAATAGQAAGLGAQGQLGYTLGSNLAGVDTSQGQNVSNLYSTMSGLQSNALLGTAGQLSSLYQNEANGVSSANVNLTADANKAGLAAGQAQMQGSSNLLGALSGAASGFLGIFK